jgi:signal transduction histidine kinase
MIERLEASFQQMKQFSTDVSHELRTPITAIRGQLEVALFTAKTTDQYREAMFNALQDIDRLSQIVRALLLLSQAESGQLVLQTVARSNLCAVVEDLTEQFQIPAEAAGITLTAELPAGALHAGRRPRADRAHDHQPALQRHQVHSRRRPKCRWPPAVDGRSWRS